MKKFSITLLILVLLSPVAANAATINSSSAVNLTNGLVGHWTFDGKDTNWNTNKTNDSAGTNTGTMTNMSTSTSPVAGEIGQGLSFDGNSRYISTTASTLVNPNLSDMTVSMWVKMTTFAYGSGQYSQRIAMQAVSAGNGWQFNEGNGATGTNQFVFTVYHDGTEVSKYTSSIFNTNQWYLVTLVWTQSGSNEKIYVNGVNQALTSNSGFSFGTADNKFYAGIRSDLYAPTSFNGSLDDIRIYNRALSATEIQTLYKEGAATVAHSNTDSGGLNNGLVGYWTMDGKDTNWGTNKTNDASGNGNTGTMTNMSTSTSPISGKIGQALKFNGSGQFIDAGSNSITGTNPFTLSAWINTTNLSSYSGAVAIGSSGSLNSAYIGVVATAQQGTSNSIGGGFYGSNWGSGIKTINKWVHVVMTFSGGNLGTARIYVNGQDLVDVPNVTPNLTSNYRKIGRIGSDTIYDFSGSIDDVRIYNRALSTQEIKALYQTSAATVAHSNTDSGGLNKGLVGYWTFDGNKTSWSSATAGTTKDSSGSNTGTLTNMSQSTSPVSGKIGQGLSFDGVDDYINAGRMASTFEGVSAFTISTWINPSVITTDETFVSKADFNMDGYGIAFGVLHSSEDSTGKNIGVYFSSSNFGITTSNFLKANTWYHAVVVYDGTQANNTGRIRIYVNGSQQALTFGGTFGATAPTQTRNVNIGRESQPSRYFNGKQDDVRIYNRALSAQEVKALYQATK